MKLVVTLGALFVSAPVFAQPQPTQPQPPQPQPAQPQPKPQFVQPPAPTPPPPNAQTLTMAEAVALAMRQDPSLRQSRASIEVARGRVDQVQATRRPTLTVTGNLTASGGGGSGALARDFLDPTTGASVGGAASWRIYDFGQTAAQLHAAKLNAEAVTAGLDTTMLDVVRNVELSYLEAVARARLVTVAEATVKSEEAHVDQAKRFVAAQAKDPIEVATAQARAANARAALALAYSNQAIALATLRAAIGAVDPNQSFVVANSWPVPPGDAPPLTSLVETARRQRPELVQADKEVAASDASIDAASAQLRPVLSAAARADWSPQFGGNWEHPGWTAGLTLSWPIYDGGRTKADVRIARANKQSAIAQRDALLIDLTSQLDATRSQIEANRAGVESSKEAVDAANAQLKLANARYAQGLGSQIELSDAETAVTTAQGNLVQSEWQLANAWTNLRRSLGER
ncbi:MAG TPA: TolC family protein [Kofleriaceae bacterium]|nr:TolC family protein [Kofleriaceae bacterium]